VAVDRFVALCLAGVLVAGVANAQPSEPKSAPLTPEQQAKVKERDRFQKEAQQLWAEGKHTEAVAAAEKMLAVEREVFGNFHPDVAGSLQLLGGMREVLEEYPAGRKARQEVLAIKTKLLGAEHGQVTDARIALEHVDRLARMTPADRHRLGESGQLNLQSFQLYQ
jgi:hypothetical protein